MTVPAGLKDILAQARMAATRAPSGKRVLPASTAQERLQALLNEISETLLSRKLVFTLGGDHKVVLEAGEGKLRGISDVTPDGLGNPDIAVSSTASHAQKCKAVLTVLSEFSQASGDLSVEPEASDTFSGSGIDGLSPADIKNADAIEDTANAAAPDAPAPKAKEEKIVDPASPPPSADTLAGTFYKTASDFATTRAITADDGGVASKSGDDQSIPLEYLVRTFASQIKMNSVFTDTAMPGPKAIYMGSPADGMPSVICFDDEHNKVVATVPNTDVEQALDKAAQVLAKTPED